MARLIHRITLLLCGALTCATANGVTKKTATITIEANVVGGCEAGLPSGHAAFHFGRLDFGHVSNLETKAEVVGQENAGAIRVRCNNNLNYAVLIDAGLHSQSTETRYLSNGVTKVKYNLYSDPNHKYVWDDLHGVSGTGNGKEQWIPIYGVVPVQTTPESGVYTDIVNITIRY